MKQNELDYDELLNANTCAQNTSYYKIMKWNRDKDNDIKDLAYNLYLERIKNHEDGNELSDWYEAKSIILLLEFIK